MAAFFISIGAGCVLAIPYAFFCKAPILVFLIAPYNMLVGSVVGAVFAYGALQGRPSRKYGWLIVWGLIAGGVTMPVGQLVVSAIAACPDTFLSPILLPLFGGVGAVLYLACEKGIRGKRDRMREQRYGRAISEHTMIESDESDPAKTQR